MAFFVQSVDSFSIQPAAYRFVAEDASRLTTSGPLSPRVNSPQKMEIIKNENRH